MSQDEVFNDAVNVVQDSLSQESARILRFSIQKNKRNSTPLEGARFGVAIRNLLAQHGIIWEEAIIYSVWFAILNEATQRLLE